MEKEKKKRRNEQKRETRKPRIEPRVRHKMHVLKFEPRLLLANTQTKRRNVPYQMNTLTIFFIFFTYMKMASVELRADYAELHLPKWGEN